MFEILLYFPVVARAPRIVWGAVGSGVVGTSVCRALCGPWCPPGVWSVTGSCLQTVGRGTDVALMFLSACTALPGACGRNISRTGPLTFTSDSLNIQYRFLSLLVHSPL